MKLKGKHLWIPACAGMTKYFEGGKGEIPPPKAGKPRSPFTKGGGKMKREGMAGAVARPTEKKEGGNKSRLWIPAFAGMTKTLIGRKAKSPRQRRASLGPPLSKGEGR